MTIAEQIQSLQIELATFEELKQAANRKWLAAVQSDKQLDQAKLESLEKDEDEAAKACRRIEAKIKGLEAAQRAHDEATQRAAAENAAKRICEANNAISAALADLDQYESKLSHAIDDLSSALATRHAAACEFHEVMKLTVLVPADADQIQAQAIRANAIKPLMPPMPSYTPLTLEKTAHAAAQAFKHLSQQAQNLG